MKLTLNLNGKATDRTLDDPWGLGEPATAVVPAVLSNAVWNARLNQSGSRGYQWPMAPGRRGA